MWGTIIGSVISAVTAIIVCILNSNANHKKLISELEKHDELQAYRIEQLEKKQDKHNNLIERTFILEEMMKVANHKIDDLERKEG